MPRKNAPAKFELSQAAITHLRDCIWQMPYQDRSALLLMSLLERNHEAVAATRGLGEFIKRMSTACSADQRVQIAEQMRDLADALDHAPAHDEVSSNVQ